MDRWFSKEITADAMRSAGLAVANKGILDVSAVAEELRLKHAHQNIAREDIEGLVVQCGAALSAPMEISTFDDIACSELVGLPPEPAPGQPLSGFAKSTGWGTPVRPRQAAQSMH